MRQQSYFTRLRQIIAVVEQLVKKKFLSAQTTNLILDILVLNLYNGNMWTKAQEQELIAMRLSGVEWQEIDKHFGKSRGCSFGKGKRLGLVQPKEKVWTEELAQELVELRKTHSLKECAYKLGFKYDYVKKRSQEIYRETGSKALITKTARSRVDVTYDDMDDLEIEYIESGQLYFDL